MRFCYSICDFHLIKYYELFSLYVTFRFQRIWSRFTRNHNVYCKTKYDYLQGSQYANIWPLKRNNFKTWSIYLNTLQNVSRNQTVDDVLGWPFPLLTLVTETIRYLKNELLARCQRSVPEFKETDILWVMTVPAIWTDSAKSLMRVAAENVGILYACVIVTKPQKW